MKVFFVQGKYCAVAHMLVEDLATRRQSRGCVLLHCVGGARFSNNLNVYHRQRIDPLNLGFARATQLSTTQHLRHLSCQRDRHVRCEGEPRGVDVGTRFFKDTREQCMGTFVDYHQCGGGGDIGSGVSTEDDSVLQICDEPRPRAVF